MILALADPDPQQQILAIAKILNLKEDGVWMVEAGLVFDNEKFRSALQTLKREPKRRRQVETVVQVKKEVVQEVFPESVAKKNGGKTFDLPVGMLLDQGLFRVKHKDWRVGFGPRFSKSLSERHRAAKIGLSLLKEKGEDFDGDIDQLKKEVRAKMKKS